MAKKLNRREFIKGIGKVTAGLAAIWAVSPDIFVGEELAEIEDEPIVVEEDTQNNEYHPYYCEGGASIICPSFTRGF